MAARALCLNMIVRNEAAIIERCLRSVADHIAAWVICDTGSTDGTQDIIRGFFAERGIPGELHSVPFHDFGQARNAALDRARASALRFDTLLLTDADMELVVHDPDFAGSLDGPAQSVMQRSNVSYWNVRLLRRDAPYRYIGVTHEVLNIPAGRAAMTDKLCFIDHAAGSNRANKYERDIRLLLGDLERDPDNARSWFYLGQCYAGSGRYAEAAETYGRRIAMGGWDEEVWVARLQQARCLLNCGDNEGFVRAALTAFNDRPHRVETLYELARYHRTIGRHAEALAFAEAGLAVPYPPKNDVLFIDDALFDYGIREEYAVAAAFAGTAAQKARGHALCEWLALCPHGREQSWALAGDAGGLYAIPAASVLPSLELSQLGAPSAVVPRNPSVVVANGQTFLTVQCADPGADPGADAPRTMLLQLDEAFAVQAAMQIACPADAAGGDGGGAHPGLDGARLLAWRGDLWLLSTARAPDGNGVARPVLSRLAAEAGGIAARDWRLLPPGCGGSGTLIPRIAGDALELIVGLDPTGVLDLDTGAVSKTEPAVMLPRLHGDAPMIAFDGGWLCVAREFSYLDRRRETHRFLFFDAANQLQRISRRVILKDGGSETVCGLAWQADGCRLVLSFEADGGAWLAGVLASDVRAVLVDVGDLRPAEVGVAWPSEPRRQAAAASADPLRSAASVRSFDLFDTLVARRCVHPAGIFDQVEQLSGHPGFARLRVEAEASLRAGPVTLDLIYAALVARHGIAPDQAARLRALEIETEHANLFPIAEHCAEVGEDDIVVSDMYLPAATLEDVVHRTCGLPGRRVVVTSGGKHAGTIWAGLQTVRPIREHLGDNPHADGASPRLAGIPARITTASRRLEVETQLADAGFEPLSNLMREARLGSWLAEPALRRAQLAQFEVNLPFLFLNTLELVQRAAAQDWDHILFSGRDCYLWSHLYNGLRPMLPGAPSACYFHTGRGVRLRPSPDYLAYFDRLRAGRRNVVVDLCGTGVSLRELLTRAPEPDTSLYLVHEMDMPAFQAPYEAQSAQVAAAGGIPGTRWPIHAVFRRPPSRGDNDVMEELNRAPAAGLDDVRVTADGFRPVFSGPAYTGEAARLFHVHQAAFRQACALLPTLARPAVQAMLERDALPQILSLYARMPGLLSDLTPLIHHKFDEETLLTEALQRPVAAAPALDVVGA